MASLIFCGHYILHYSRLVLSKIEGTSALGTENILSFFHVIRQVSIFEHFRNSKLTLVSAHPSNALFVHFPAYFLTVENASIKPA